jgi:uncharacterized repeat protein (TIGR04138 family)
MQKINFNEAVLQIVAADPRYDRDAYQFVREGLDFTIKLHKKDATAAPQHVSGQELLTGIRQFALEQFGPLAKTVLEHWGIRRCEDFGEIVFNLVEKGVLGKTEQDSRNDFKGGYDFDEAFVLPFRPVRRARSANTAPTGSRNIFPRDIERTPGSKKLNSGSN